MELLMTVSIKNCVSRSLNQYSFSFVSQEKVHHHTLVNKIEVKEFTDNRRGLKWMKNFMKHYKFSDKKAEMVSTMQKEYSSNLFKVCDFKNVIDVV